LSHLISSAGGASSATPHNQLDLQWRVIAQTSRAPVVVIAGSGDDPRALGLGVAVERAQRV
jgi:hypothetical protein